MKALGPAIKVNNSLVDLNLGTNELKDTGIIILAKNLIENHSITSLGLGMQK